MKALRLLFLCLALFAIFQASALAVDPTPTQTVQIPMQDGTKLTADVYLPNPNEGSFPVVLCRSTYGRIGGPVDQIMKKGMAVVAQDVRGMGDSEGEKYVFNADGWRDKLNDGADTIEWVRAQKWCNGKIVTWGGSALGITQMLMSPTTKHLAGQFIEVAPSNHYEDLAFQGGVFRKCLLEGWCPAIKQPHIVDVYKGHPTYDDFWTYYNVEQKAPEITTPAVFVGGWFDIFNQGTIDGFVSRETNGGPGAKGNNYLVMKWSPHGADTTKDYKHRENRWLFHVEKLREAFYAKYLLGDDTALKSFAKVNYYTMGSDADGAPGNEWRTAEMWPPFPTDATSYYLCANGSLSTDEPEKDFDARTFLFDPKNPVKTRGGANLLIPAGPYDQREVTKDRADILQFATKPLKEPMEITGHVFVKLFVSSDAPDTDFTAKLVDIYPKGDDRQILMLDSIRRVKTRLGYDKVAPLLTGPDDVVEIEIDLQSISWVFDKGHRIGLHISSSNFNRFEVNPNTGADFPKEGAEMRAANNTVHMSKTRPSAIILPVRPK